MRCFISIELPEQIRKEIYRDFETLKNSGYAFGNFVQKDNLHLTLKFLGNISEEKIEEIKKKLEEIDLSKFSASTGDIGFFPSEKYVRVIWVELIADKIKELKQIIDDKLHEINVNHETRDFSAHVTVARIKKVKDKENFMKKLKEINLKKMNFDIDGFYLFKSELRKEGPVYKLLKKFDF